VSTLKKSTLTRPPSFIDKYMLNHHFLPKLFANFD